MIGEHKLQVVVLCVYLHHTVALNISIHSLIIVASIFSSVHSTVLLLKFPEILFDFASLV